MGEVEKATEQTLIPKNKKRAIKAQIRPKPMDRRFSGRFFYGLGMFLTHLLVTLEVRGLENLPPDSPYILAANHETFVDGMWIMSALPKKQRNKFCCIGAQDLLTKYGPFGKIIMRVGRGIPINRFGNPIRALISAKEALDEGSNILLIHPEGTRSKTGKLGKIQEGACYVSTKAQVPLVPVFLDGGYNIFNRNMPLPYWRHPVTKKRHKLIITFGKAFLPQDYENTKSMNQALTDWLEDAFLKKEIPNVPMKKKSKA